MSRCLFCGCDGRDLLDCGLGDGLGFTAELEVKVCRQHVIEFGDTTIEDDGYVVCSLSAEKLARRARVVVVKPQPNGSVAVRVCPEEHVQ